MIRFLRSGDVFRFYDGRNMLLLHSPVPGGGGGWIGWSVRLLYLTSEGTITISYHDRDTSVRILE